MKIKAIETEYNGYRFRSRLEARWAVFFDNARIKYEYEPEGFELSCGKYLPDFFLPDFDIYVEIKPFDRTVVKCVGDNNKWEQKCATFRDETGHAILLCYGEPAEDIWKELFAFYTTDSGGGCADFDALFREINGEVFLVALDLRRDGVVYTRETYEKSPLVLSLFESFKIDETFAFRSYEGDKRNYDLFDKNANDVLNVARKAARQARFEHGEKPEAAHV